MTDELRARIERALTGQELTVLYQPIVDLATGMPVGYEALSRFTLEPTQSPDRWFADADSAGLRPQLELLALERALDGLALLPPDCHLAINASPGTALTPEFAERLCGVPLDRIVLEITEHAPIDDYHAFERGLRELRRDGLRLAVDDAAPASRACATFSSSARRSSSSTAPSPPPSTAAARRERSPPR